MNHKELTLEAVREALSFIPSDDRDIWVKIGMALKDEFGDNGRDAWFDWSSSSPTYNEQDATHVWKSIKASGKVTIASLVFEAKQFGWKMAARHSQRITPEEYARKQQERELRRAQDESAAKAKAERAAKRATAIWNKATPATDHPYLTRKGIQPHGTRIVPVWERDVLDESTGEIITVSVLNALLVPIFSGPKEIATIQAIFAEKNDVLGRDKDYLPGGAKQGGYYTIGKIGKSTLRVVICEGFATGASIHEATGYPVMVAFDAGNLLAVATALRAKLPDVAIIVAADNDLWTKGNPGARKANAAAHAVNGRLALPIFTDLDSYPTDFNDLRNPEQIRTQIDGAIDPVEPELFTPDTLYVSPDPEPEPVQEEPPVDDAPPPEAQDQAPPPPPPPSDPTRVADEASFGLNRIFRVLGYDHEKYYVFQYERKQLTVLTASSFTDTGFLTLAPLQAWELAFPATNGGFSKKDASNWLIRLAHDRKIYDPSLTRGRGAWVDRGRIVLHMGNKLVVDGQEVEITDFESRYVYELDRSLPALSPTAMSSEEGEELLQVASMFRWSKPASAPMLVGWCALAPLCGALRWRPHVWLTGGAGTGKSWILNNFVLPLMNNIVVFAQGNSTEAGIRQKLNQDALPVLFDESEKNNEKEKQRVDGVLALIRQASTESAARTFKGSAFGQSMEFHIRSMFCLASVQVGMEHQADYERLAVLALRPKREKDPDAEERWNKLKEKVYTLIQRDEDLAARLFRRSLDLLPTTLANIETFATTAAKKFGSQRDGDQYGTLMAGAWSLISTRAATPEEAREMLDSYDWGEYMEHADSDDSIKALSVVLGSHVRMPGGTTLTIHELLLLSRFQQVPGADPALQGAPAEAMLGRYGIKIMDDELCFANNSHALQELISHTPFAADLRGQLLRIQGARRYPKPIWVNGITSRAIAIPLKPLVSSSETHAATVEDDRPF